MINFRPDDAEAARYGRLAGADILFTGNIVKVDPRSVFSVDKSLGSKNDAVFCLVLQSVKHGRDLVRSKIARRFDTEGVKDLIRMMVVMVAVVMAMIVVMMMVMVIVIVMIMVMMLMVMIVVVIFIVMMVMMLMVMVVVMIVIIVIMVVMAGAVRIIALFAIIMVMMVVMMLVGELLHGVFEAVFFHGGKDLGAGDLIPGGGDQAAVRIKGTQEFHRLKRFGIIFAAGAAENEQVGMDDLVIEKLAEVAHVHFALGSIDDRDLCTELNALHRADSLRHIRQFSDARGLDDDAVRRVSFHDLLEGFAKVPHQGAADAAGIHFRDLNAGILQKTAVNGDLAEFVFDQNEFFALIGFLDQLADERGLPRPEKT